MVYISDSRSFPDQPIHGEHTYIEEKNTFPSSIPGGTCILYTMFPVLLYAGAHFGAYYCMDIHFWYSGVYHVELRDHAVFFRNV